MKKLLKMFEAAPATEQTEAHKCLQLFVSPDDAPPVLLPPGPCALDHDEGFYYFTQRDIPIREATKGGLVMGAPGSGKTACVFRPLFQSIEHFVRIKIGKGVRIVIFDAKGDALPFLASLGFTPGDGILQILNAFDERGVHWRIAEDLQEPARALNFARKIAPEEKNSTAPFFTDAACLLVYAVILALNAVYGTRWTLRDLLCALESAETIAMVVAKDPEAKAIAAGILNDQRHSPGVIASLLTKIRRFSQVAALWANNPKAAPFSINEFLSTPGILVLGYDPVLKESWVPLLELFLRCYADEMLKGPETLDPTNFLLLDEFTSMGRFDKDKTIVDLFELGRSKGVCVFIGVQSYAAMVDIYTEAGANRILSLCGHKMFLHIGDPQSAKWCEDFIGKRRLTEKTFSESWGNNGATSSISCAVQDRSLILASTFMNIPYPGPGKDFFAICDVPSAGAVVLSSRSFDQILAWAPEPVVFETVKRLPGVKSQSLLPWSEKEKGDFLKAAGQSPDGKAGSNSNPPPKKPYLPPLKKPKGDDPNQQYLL